MEQNIQSVLPPMTLLQSGKYRIDQLLGSGGFGNTYRVTHTLLGTTMAVKEFFMQDINLRRGQEVTVSMATKEPTFQGQKSKFMKEAQRIAQLRSSHIVRVTDIFEENGTCYYVMDYIDGQSLADYLKQRRQLSEQEAMAIFSQVLDALQEVHSQRPTLLHLDIKPANIMLDRTGKAYLVDFGASKQFEAGDGITTSSAIALSKAYAPLELLDLDPQLIGPWTDYYELGVTLYCMLTGQLPPTATKLSQGAPLNIPPTVSPQTRHLITTLMQQRCKDRPQNIAALQQLMHTRATDTPHSGDTTHYDTQTTWIDGQSRNLNGQQTQYSGQQRYSGHTARFIPKPPQESLNLLTIIILALFQVLFTLVFLGSLIGGRNRIDNIICIAAAIAVAGNIFAICKRRIGVYLVGVSFIILIGVTPRMGLLFLFILAIYLASLCLKKGGKASWQIMK